MLLLVLFGGCGDRGPATRSAGDPTGPCEIGRSTRWLPDGDLRYRVRDTYGSEPEEWLHEVRGLAFAGDHLFLLDGAEGTLTRLTASLANPEEIAGPGDGPGELTKSPGFPADWLAARDSLVFVFDGGSVTRRLSTGTLLDERRASGGPSPFETKRIVAGGRSLLFDRDSPDFKTGERFLQVSRLDSAGPTPLSRFELAELPDVGGRQLTGGPVNQAQPSWDAADSCLWVTDGSEVLVAVHLPSGGRDTLRLPEIELPEEASEDRAMKARIASLSRHSLEDLEEARPTARARWSDLRVDPDGVVWLAVWKPYSMRYDSTRVIALRQEKEPRSMRLPGFPLAFGEPGHFYTIVRDRATDQKILYHVALEERPPNTE